MRHVLALPLSTVERAGMGDLVSRTTADVDALARSIRFAIPETLIAAVTTTLTVAAAVWVSPAAALALVVGVPAIVIGTRWYLKRAPQGYLRERAAYATLAGTVGETVDGGLTVESLSLHEDRVRPRRPTTSTRRTAAERYTLRLRTFWFPTAEIAYVLPVVAALAWGGWLVHAGHANIGQVTAVVLYAVQLADPVDRLISWLDEIQVGGASLARLVGITTVPPDRIASDEEPTGRGSARPRRPFRVRRRTGRAARHRPRPRAGRARRGRRAVRRGQVDARPPPRGNPPAAHRQGRGRRRAPRRAAARDAPPGGRARHAGAARVRRHARGQPPARAAGRRARGARSALAAVDALEWADAAARRARDGRRRRRRVAHARRRRSSSRSPGSSSPTHTRSSSTRRRRSSTHVRPATSSARSPRCSTGRTVVAIAHRLHTAHDADRVAVVEDGLLDELGTHDELLRAGRRVRGALGVLAVLTGPGAAPYLRSPRISAAARSPVSIAPFR